MPKFVGWRGKRHFAVRTTVSKRYQKKCGTCGRAVRRSHRTGILWDDCFTCRYLKMIYGPSIKVVYHPGHED